MEERDIMQQDGLFPPERERFHPGWTGATEPMGRPKPAHGPGRTWAIVGIIAVILVAVCGAGVYVLGSGASHAGNAVRANPQQSMQAAKPTGTSSAVPQTSGRIFGLAVGSAVEVTTDDGIISVGITKVQRITTCGQYDGPQHKGDVFLVVSLEATVTSGTADVNPYDWNFTDSGGSTPDQAYADCSHKLGIASWPGEDGVRAGKKLVGYVEWEVKPGTTGEVTFAPFLTDLASWQITK